MNEKTLERYLKVKAHADRGVSGEKEAALKVLAELEVKYPGIGRAAALHAAEKGRSGTGLPPNGSVPPEAPDPFPRAPQPPPSRRPAAQPDPGRSQGNWENIFRYAQGFYETVKEVVEDASLAQYGRNLAESEVEMTAGNRDRAIFLRIKIPFDTVGEARDLNALQKETFRQAIHDMLDEYLDALVQGT